MANRSYIYLKNKEKLRDFGEWKSDIPLSYKILISENGRITKSNIWEFDNAAIEADYEIGKIRLFGFLKFISEKKLVDDIDVYDKDFALTKEYIEKREGEKVILEPTEYFELVTSSDEEIVAETKDLIDTCKQIGEEIDILLSLPVTETEEYLISSSLGKMILNLKENWKDELGIGIWAFRDHNNWSFNNS